MARHRIFATSFAQIYPLYVQKAERKQRTKDEVDQVICWLTGYDQAGLERQIGQQNDLETFFAEAPALNPNSALKGARYAVYDVFSPRLRSPARNSSPRPRVPGTARSARDLSRGRSGDVGCKGDGAEGLDRPDRVLG